MVEMHTAGRRPDVPALASAFASDERMKRLGDSPMVALVDSAGLPSQAGFYADQIIDFYKRRSALLDMAEARERLEKSTILDEPAGEVLDDLISQIIDLESDTHDVEDRALHEISQSAMSQIDAALERRQTGRLAGLTTGLKTLDQKLGGFINGRLYIIAGRTSMGKTALAVGAALRLAEDGHKVWFRSLEMSGEEIYQRWLAVRTGIPVDAQSKGQISDIQHLELAEERRKIDALPLLIDDSPPEIGDRLAMKILRAHHRHRPAAMFVDYLQLIRAKPGSREPRYELIGQMAIRLKSLAKQLQVPMIVMAQIGRRVEERANKRPMLSDLRESGNIEQDSDVILMLYRQSYYEPEYTDPDQMPRENEINYKERCHEAFAKWQSERNHAEIIVAKNRQGPTGTVHAGFNGELMKFYEGKETDQ